jgi:hypothetical protein
VGLGWLVCVWRLQVHTQIQCSGWVCDGEHGINQWCGAGCPSRVWQDCRVCRHYRIGALKGGVGQGDGA